LAFGTPEVGTAPSSLDFLTFFAFDRRLCGMSLDWSLSLLSLSIFSQIAIFFSTEILSKH
jgi:hypothetical protein